MKKKIINKRNVFIIGSYKTALMLGKIVEKSSQSSHKKCIPIPTSEYNPSRSEKN